jgi:hypothetical protein
MYSQLSATPDDRAFEAPGSPLTPRRCLWSMAILSKAECMLPLTPLAWSHGELCRLRYLLNRSRAQHPRGPLLIKAGHIPPYLRESPLETHTPQVLGLLEARALKPGQAKEWWCDSTELPVMLWTSTQTLRVERHGSVSCTRSLHEGHSPCGASKNKRTSLKVGDLALYSGECGRTIVNVVDRSCSNDAGVQER